MIFKNKSENYFRMLEQKITLKELKKDKLVIKAFQQRYRSSKVDGEIDQKTLKISHFMAS